MLRIETPAPGLAPADWPGIPAWLAGLLTARGIGDEKAAAAFLEPSLDQLLPPGRLNDMDRAVALLREAREKGWTAAIYGDYDVDGVSASAILWEALGQFGLRRTVYIPDRHAEGYGLNIPAVEKLAESCQLLITVDCGITSVQEVAAAKALGMRVIVTDHHRHGDALPPADAVISPLLADYPFPFLCGAGVAWKVALALLRQAAMPLMELAALATVADMVPLTGENRVIVKLGLEKIAGSGRPGLRAVMNRAGIRGRVTSEQVGFQIAPRMNACGRLASARIAFDMLTTRDAREAEELALRMETLNQRRKDEEAHVIEEALAQVERMDLVAAKAIVVCGEGWNSGVVGLAAGRIAEKYAYPTVALAREGDTCVGSARSAGEIDIHQALSRCADLFDRFGGHRQAAGLTMAFSHLTELKERLSDAVAEQTGGEPVLPVIRCDGEMTLSQVTEETVRWLERLEPFGVGNPSPRFLCEGAAPLSLRAVGAEGRHLKCTFRQGDTLRDGIYFGGGEYAGQLNGRFRLVMTPTVNEFRGKISAECRIYALQLQPESLRMDQAAAMAALCAETLGKGRVPLLTDGELDARMAGGQGTLLVCRCLATAHRMLGRYPRADFFLGRADDPRAYHGVLLYGTAAGACAPFRHVVLCDGDLGEGDAWRSACPGADIAALPVTAEVKALLAAAFVDVDALRGCYRLLRQRPPRDLIDASEQLNLTQAQCAFTLAVLGQIGLMDVAFSPFRARLLPMVKRSPEESALFRLARQAKEETHGLYSV
ncbi:MAG: single-stranded-DNA-specific exonuclease RecJ [Clostridia bacterium]|nr:single-stranded-DNA-specific exonuclease RecJ [Clostridia bacterium]